MKKPTEAELQRLTAFLRHAPHELAYTPFVGFRSPEEARKFLLDILSKQEVEILENRMKALFAVRIAPTWGVSQAEVERRVGVNSTTFRRARSVWEAGNGGARRALEQAKKRFSPLAPLR